MGFVRGAWKVLVAIKDGLVLLLLLLFFALIFMALSYRPTPVSVNQGALLLDLDGVIVEEPEILNPLELLSGGDAPVRQFRLLDVVHGIRSAADDNRVKAIVLDLDGFMGGGRVAMSEVGDALAMAKAKGKPIYAFATYYGDDAYQLAAYADEIWLDPLGGMAFAGPGGSQLYYKNALDRFKVDAHVYRVGTYKSAVEPYLRSDQSQDAREAMRAIYAPIWQNWLDQVAKARPKAQAAAYAADPAGAAKASNGDLTKVAIDMKLADKIGSRIEFGERIAKLVGEDRDNKPGHFAANRLDDWLAANPAKTSGSEIGVVTIAGTIVDGDAGPGTAGGDRIAKLLEDGLSRNFKALVVRVDSPGGSVFASEAIRRGIQAYRDRNIPVVVSMSNVAASGGYWVSTASDAIFAEPSTITGSIGVFAVLPSFERVLAEYGINSDGIATTPLSGQPDVLGGFNDSFDTMVQTGVENNYNQFLTLVANARGKTKQQIDAIAQGRVWDGGTARQLGLIDRFGSFDDALADAAKRAKLADGDYHPVFLATAASGWERFFVNMFTPEPDDSSNDAGQGMIAHMTRERSAAIGQLLADIGMMKSGSVQALCLECRADLPARRSADSLSVFARLFGRAMP